MTNGAHRSRPNHRRSGGPNHTDGSSGNWAFAEVEEVDWEDCTEENEFPARLQLVTDDE